MNGRPRRASIVVDARAIDVSGIGRYLRETLSALLGDARFGPVSLWGDPTRLGRFIAAVGADARILPGPARLYSPRAQLSWLYHRLAGSTAADVAFFPHYDVPLAAAGAARVVTVHDLIHFRVPELFPAWRRSLARIVLRRAVRAGAAVVTGSESTRADIVAELPWAAATTHVVPYGVDEFFRPVPVDGAPSYLRGLPPFVLCVGNRKPHKNLDVAVEALALARLTWPALKLVSAGRSYPGWDRVLERSERLGVRSAVVSLDDVSDADLRWLYSHCEALVFPSRYEGFGLPLLEAMACGAPVVAARSSSIPEVVGDAGLLAEPGDASGLADAVLRLRADATLRRDLVERGYQRARHFLWRHSTRRTLDLLHAVATRSRSAAPGREAPLVSSSASESGSASDGGVW